MLKPALKGELVPLGIRFIDGTKCGWGCMFMSEDTPPICLLFRDALISGKDDDIERCPACRLTTNTASAVGDIQESISAIFKAPKSKKSQMVPLSKVRAMLVAHNKYRKKLGEDYDLMLCSLEARIEKLIKAHSTPERPKHRSS